MEEGAPETAVIGVGPAPMPIDALEKSLTTGVFDPGSEVVDGADLEIEGADATRTIANRSSSCCAEAILESFRLAG